MAEIKLQSKDRIRVYADYEKDNFIDVSGEVMESCIGVEFYPWRQYVEIRKKDSVCKMFLFKNLQDKKDYNYGYWEDAEVIFTISTSIGIEETT